MGHCWCVRSHALSIGLAWGVFTPPVWGASGQTLSIEWARGASVPPYRPGAFHFGGGLQVTHICPVSARPPTASRVILQRRAFQEAAVGSGSGGESPHPTAVPPELCCSIAGSWRHGRTRVPRRPVGYALRALKESVDGWPMASIILRHSEVNRS